MPPRKLRILILNTNPGWTGAHLEFFVFTLLAVNLSVRWFFAQLAQIHVRGGDSAMTVYGPGSSQPQGASLKVMARLYKFALVLTANEELARGLLRGTLKALNSRNEWQEDNTARVTAGFRRMYALWSAKLGEDPGIQKKCPPDPRIFASIFAKSSPAGNAQFARFIANLPSPQRGVLYLVYGEQASYDEAADIAAMNMTALMTMLARGHAALSQLLDQRGAGAERTPACERAA
jgi:RNA polymerase sigma-70 factor, ECF subfamily